MGKPLRVLIVEDSEDDALLIFRELRRGGYDPTFLRVDTPAATAAALNTEKWDVVISDYVMPLFSAFAALNMLRQRDLDLPFIIVSGAIGEETAVAAMKFGAHDYIMKDNLKRLIPAIERELRDVEVRRERKRTQKAFAESEERYRSLVENLDMGITLIDSNFKIVMANDAAARIAKPYCADLIGQNCFQVFEGRGEVCTQCPAITAMALGQAVEIEVQRTTSSGDHRIVRIRAVPTLGPDGSANGCMEVAEDITDRKRLEERLRHSAQMEAIGRLAGGVAHDFNNLLTAMIGYSSVLMEQMPQDSEYREKVVQVAYAAERAAGLTRQLLAFGRKQVLEVKAIDLNQVISSFVKMIRGLVGEHIDLITRLSPGLGLVKADRGQIEQVLMNLALNGRDAMPMGGTIAVCTDQVNVDRDYARTHPDTCPGTHVMFSVSDTGSGMDAETLTHIFDPFFTTKQEGKGTGLGLSTVYGIVKQHQGHIAVHSEPGRGTTFEVCLPLYSEAACFGQEEMPAESEPGGDETILVVEDEEIVRNVACEVLELLGYTVFAAAEAESAMEISRRHPGQIHLLLADVVLPRMDGASLFSRLSATRAEMRVLYVSGYQETSFIRRGVLHHGVDFLQKPFTFVSLGRKVREILDRPATQLCAAGDQFS